MLNTLAIAILSASAALAPVNGLPHLHPHIPVQDNRVAVVLDNTSPGFIDLRINGQDYTVLSHHKLAVKAPAGTLITSGSTTYRLRPGQVIATLDPNMQGQHISLR